MLATETPLHNQTIAPLDDPFLNVFQVAEIPQVHPQTVRKAFRDKRLRGVKLNGSRVLRFRLSWVLQWLEGSNVA